MNIILNKNLKLKKICADLLALQSLFFAANLEAILDVEDVDFVFLGPTDLSAAMGERPADLPPG